MSNQFTADDFPKLNEDIDCGTMPANVAELANAVVGHKIVKVDREAQVQGAWYGPQTGLRLTLDDGTQVELADSSDCCAFTDLEDVIEHLPSVDHIVTAVRPDEDYSTWHIVADFGDIMDLKVGWSAGNPFYYGYGFGISVKPAVK